MLSTYNAAIGLHTNESNMINFGNTDALNTHKPAYDSVEMPGMVFGTARLIRDV